ncbi:MAG: AI-2E family transporter [Fimbriimonadaceae bacterium]
MNQAAAESGWESTLFSPSRIRVVVLVLGITTAFYLCWLMIRPFLAVITWAAALAILAHPLHAWLERRTRPSAAAVISVGLVAVVIVAPAVFLSQRLFAELSETLLALGADLNSSGLHTKLQRYPAMVSFLEWIGPKLDIEQQIQAAAGAVAGRMSALVSGSVWLLTQLVLTFLTLFYFFRDRTVCSNFFAVHPTFRDRNRRDARS